MNPVLPVPQRWDIFCTVVDNFGDIGVCWRLARQLAAEYGLDVRLWVDDLFSFSRIQPEIDPALNQQVCAGVIVRHWLEPFTPVEPCDVVIEAFGCSLPAAFLEAMRATRPVWINLEYLSAEEWVEGCHGLPSPQLGLEKYFFFPGFTVGTGGVLGEAAMRAARGRWSAQDRAELLGRHASVDSAAQVISLFGYENPALTGLVSQWAAGAQPLHVLLPEGRLLPQMRAALAAPELAAGLTVRRGSLALTCLSMLPQDGYDQLLWSCDLNFVRGEDSFVRSQWAALPFVWHIYPQDEDAHHVKLEAFMDRYCQGLSADAAQALRVFWREWNRGEGAGLAWPAFSAALPALLDHARVWASRLAVNGDLAANLVKFVSGKVK